MKIKLNSDQEVVSTVREGLKRTGGYCPAVWSARRLPGACVRSLRTRLLTPILRATATVCSITNL